MNKWILAVFLLVVLSACGSLHDGRGWEHNMDDSDNSILEHNH